VSTRKYARIEDIEQLQREIQHNRLEFSKFVNNDFLHLEEAFGKVRDAVNVTRGTMVIFVPLILAILSLVIYSIVGR